MAASVRLSQAECPCGCRGPVLLHPAEAGRGVTCPTTRRRYGLPTGVVLKQSFSRKQWDACRDPRLLRQALAVLRTNVSVRKRRLVAAAIAGRLTWCRNPSFLEARRVAESLAETGTTDADCLALAERLAPSGVFYERLEGWQIVGLRLLQATPELTYDGYEETDPLGVALAIQEVVGNPFREAPFDSEWRTHAVCQLATSIATHKAYCDLPVLADALEEAGCHEVPALTHLRGRTPHALGCWALDWVRDGVNRHDR